MKNKQEIIEKKFKEVRGIDKKYSDITNLWCPHIVGLKDHGDTATRCSLTCEECWLLAVGEMED